ncbi:hypothetical protein R1flu_005378 [Riccia fluitans]|uniref:Uncharacterized protein n=1 Tax=Riccia fluitans TaxID=41844 RepID=A0ABD1YTZ0_9MARC
MESATHPASRGKKGKGGEGLVLRASPFLRNQRYINATVVRDMASREAVCHHGFTRFVLAWCVSTLACEPSESPTVVLGRDGGSCVGSGQVDASVGQEEEVNLRARASRAMLVYIPDGEAATCLTTYL